MPGMRMQGLEPFQVLARFFQHRPWIPLQSFGDDLVVSQAAAIFARQCCHEPDFQLQTEYGGQSVNRSQRGGLRPGFIGSNGRL